MFKPTSLRRWATPLTIGSFVLMAGSGLLMFFDIVPGYVVFAHEWLSWLFLLGVAAHVILNQKAFVRHLATAWGRASLAAFAGVLVLSTMSFGQYTAPELKWPLTNALVEARLSVLADLAHMTSAQLVGKLARHRILAKPDETVQQLAARYNIDDFQILGLIFLPG